MAKDDKGNLMFRPEAVREALDRMGSMSKATHEAMEREGALHIEFRIINNKIEYSHTKTEVPRDWLAVAIIRAVEEWEVVPQVYDPDSSKVPGWFKSKLSESGKKIEFDRHIEFRWAEKKIRTSIPPEDGDTFLSVAAYFVSLFQKESDAQRQRSEKRGSA